MKQDCTAAKSLQSCLTLCDPIDGSPSGSAVPGILQARTLEWVAISFSNAWKWNLKVKSLSRVWLFATPWTAAYQAPPSIGFSRQQYWSGVPSPSPENQWQLVKYNIYGFRFQFRFQLKFRFQSNQIWIWFQWIKESLTSSLSCLWPTPLRQLVTLKVNRKVCANPYPQSRMYIVEQMLKQSSRLTDD